MSALFQIFAKIWIRGWWLYGQSCRGKTYTPYCPWESNYLGNENPGTKSNCPPSAWVYWLCSPNVTLQMGFPLTISPCAAPWWGGTMVNETQTFFMVHENISQAKTKKIKTPLRILFRKWTRNWWKLLSIDCTWINRRNPNHQAIPIPD